MAATREVFRQLMRELKLIYKTDNLHNVPAYAYVESQFRRFQVTGEKECRGKEEAKHMAQTYLCLLKSVRLQEELNAQYKGKGERSIESSARMVGLALPQKPADLDNTPPPR
ncbi:protein FMC1 homolog [Pomacea canaliculata]|uniref:protein FMC1 homolog n=1 Tax=Pomacea canaliculata TaxID=400727 RepID=UPI000D73F9B5|nr:protein FMC1 homolog [Pomacea canaliculata]